MAELQVGIRADVKDAKRVVKSLKDIRRAAGDSSATLAAASKTAKTAGASYNIASGSALKLAGATDLTSAANAALANTLRATAAGATSTATAGAAATKSTNLLTAAFTRLRTVTAGLFAGPSAGLKRFATQARTAAGSVVGLSTAAAGLGAAVAVGIGVGIKNAVQFEKTLSRIEGLVGIAASEVEAFKKPLLEIGKATAKGPNELAEALFFVTSAGFKGEEALSVLEASAKAAAAGLGETKQVADAVTSAINAYGIENLSAAQSTDILVATVREGKAEADSIAGALGQVLPIASELGVGFEQLGGTIAALTRIGLGADQGATALGATLAAIQKPGEDAKLALKEVGLSAEELRRKVREEGLLPVLQDLRNAFGDNEAAIARVFPNVRALRAVLPLVGANAAEVAGIFERVADATGSTDKAFDAFTKTSAFTLQEAMVALQVSLQKIGEDLLPAVAKAFVWLAEAVESTVDGFTGLGEAIAEAIGGSDDHYIRAINRQRELNDAIANLTLGQEIITGFDDMGNPIKERLGELSEFDKKIAALQARTFGIAGLDVTGTFDEIVEQLREAKAQQDKIVEGIERENFERIRVKDTIEEIVVEATKRGPLVDPLPIDQDRLDKAKKTYADLQTAVRVLTNDLGNLANLGKQGIGLAEDAEVASQVYKDLQGTIQGLSKKDIEELLAQKRRLETAIAEVNNRFMEQDQARMMIDDIRKGTALAADEFERVSSGGSLIDLQATQQAADIIRVLGENAGMSADELRDLILQQQAWNTALKGIDPSGLQDLVVQRDALIKQQGQFAEGSAGFERYAQGIESINEQIINAGLSAEGLPQIDQIILEALPKPEQFELASERLREAFNLAGVVDPDADPRFQAALDRLKDKMFGISDIMAEFGKAAAQNLQQNFSDFLFNPFEEGLEGMARNFANTLHRLASDLLANQILTSFFKSLSGAGGGIGALGTAALGGLQGGFASGGDFSANKPMLVGEQGPEIITPRQSGSVIPNEMLGGQAQAPKVEVGGPTIINTIEDDAIVAAFNRGGGGQVILNDMSEKRSAYRQALGINN